MQKNILIAITLFSTLVVTSTPAFADSYGYYGSTPVTNCLVIDKLMSKPDSDKEKSYVDNITVNDAKYKPDQTMIEMIKIRNTTNTIVPNVLITSTVPSYLRFVSGPVTFDKGGTTFTIKAGDLSPQEERIFYVTLRAVGRADLPAQPYVIFPNTVRGQGDTCSAAEDTAQIIIEQQVLGTTKGGQSLESVAHYPQTGPELGLLVLAAQAGIAGFGIALKKYAQN